MDYERLRPFLAELDTPEQARIFAGIAELVYRFPRILVELQSEGAVDPWLLAGRGFIGKLVDVLAGEYLCHAESLQDCWKTYGVTIVPLAFHIALESRFFTEGVQTAEIELALRAWPVGEKIHVESSEQIPEGLILLGILQDRWNYWEAAVLRRKATVAEVLPRLGSASRGGKRSVAVNGAHLKTLRASRSIATTAGLLGMAQRTYERAEAGEQVSLAIFKKLSREVIRQHPSVKESELVRQ